MMTLSENVKSLVKKHGETAAVWVCYGITAASVVVRVIMYCKARSLWLDEAMLAESIVTRSFRSLLASPLANGQTAPALYLYVVKLFGVLTGYSEGGLRILSLLMFLGALPIEYLLLTRAFNVGKAGTAFAISATSTLSIYMRYSNELKPYMGDVFFVLAILWLYHLYGTRKITLPRLVFACCLGVLFSTPALFFIASVFICEFVFAAAAKDKGRVIKTFCAGAVVLAFFLAYYVWWLRPVADSESMVDFWKNNNFAVWPPAKSVLKHDIKLIYGVLGMAGCLYVPFACAGFIASLVRKDKVSWVAGCALALVFAASCLKKWPMVNRLWLFVYALEIMYTAICFQRVKAVVLDSGSLPCKVVFTISALVMLALNGSFVRNAGGGLYLETEEANPLIAYAREHVAAGEYLYVYAPATFVVKYKNGYDTDTIGNGAIIWGGDRTEWGNLNQNNATGEVGKITAAQKAYLLFYHTGPSGGIAEGLAALAARGFVHKVGAFHDTPLYYFTTDPEDPKRSETHDFGR